MTRGEILGALVDGGILLFVYNPEFSVEPTACKCWFEAELFCVIAGKEPTPMRCSLTKFATHFLNHKNTSCWETFEED